MLVRLLSQSKIHGTQPLLSSLNFGKPRTPLKLCSLVKQVFGEFASDFGHRTSIFV